MAISITDVFPSERLLFKPITIENVRQVSKQTLNHDWYTVTEGGPIYCVSPATVASFTDSAFDLLVSLFHVSDLSKVYKFLVKNPSIITPLLESQKQIALLFGSVKPSIEIVIDSEDTTWKTLFVNIPLGDHTEESFEKFDSFLMNWGFAQTKEFKKKVTFSLA